LTLGVGSWSVSCCGPSIHPKEGWFDPTADLQHGSDEKNPCPCQQLNLNSTPVILQTALQL